MDTLAVVSRPKSVLPRKQHTNRLPEIEVLRTIAVLMVMAEHIPTNLVFWPSEIAQSIFSARAGYGLGWICFSPSPASLSRGRYFPGWRMSPTG